MRARDAGSLPAPAARCVRRGAAGAARGAQTATLLVGLGLDDLLAAVVAGGADVMAAVHLAGHRLERERRRGEGSCARCMPRFDGDFLFCWTAMECLLSWMSAIRSAHASTLVASSPPAAFNAASAANAECRRGGGGPPAPCVRRRAIGLAARDERQRQQQLVLGERQRVERRGGEDDLVLVLIVEPRELALVAGEQQQRRLRDRPRERAAGSAGSRAARSLRARFRAPGGPARRPCPRSASRSRPARLPREPVDDPRQRRGVDRPASPARAATSKASNAPSRRPAGLLARPCAPLARPRSRTIARSDRRRGRRSKTLDNSAIAACQKCPQKQ